MSDKSSDEQLKAIIKRAIDITKDFEEPYRSKAFEIILANSLSASLNIGQKNEAISPRGDITVKPSSIQTNIQNLAKKCNVSIEQLNDIFDFQETYPIFIVPLKEMNQRNRRLFLDFCLLHTTMCMDKIG